MIRFLFLITLLTLATVCLAYVQEFTFYAGLNYTGDSFTTRSKHPDFRRQAPDVLSDPKSYCARGLWGLYTEYNYTGGSSTGFWGELNSNVKCVGSYNFSSLLTSVRSLGPYDTDTQSISFYSGQSNHGSEVVVDGPEYSPLNFQPRSIVSTGRSNWTLYSGVNFNGTATCYVSTRDIHFSPSFDLPITRSLLRGCNRHIDTYFYPKSSP